MLSLSDFMYENRKYSYLNGIFLILLTIGIDYVLPLWKQ